MGAILAYLILAIPIFTKVYDDLTPAELGKLISNYSFKCQYLVYLCTQLYGLLNEISIIVGNSRRISQLKHRLIKQQQQLTLSIGNQNHRSDQNQSEAIVCFSLKDLNIMTPTRTRRLIKNLNFVFREHVNVLLSGNSGCGKTSLFRCICGLWNSYDGQIEHVYSSTTPHSPFKLFFLPQSAQFTNDSLLAPII